MAKLNIDEQAQLADPIEITLDGKNYTVRKVTTDLMGKVTELGKSTDLDVLIKELALLVGVEPDEFKEADVRKVGKALDFIMSEIEKGISKPKNS